MIPSVTNEMRRDLAKRLRSAIKDSPRKDMIYDATLTAILGIGVNFYEGYTDASDVAHLADLIDRPTCSNLAKPHGMSPVGAENWFECSKCHCKAQMNKIGMPLSYCPNCGAEIEGDMECIS